MDKEFYVRMVIVQTVTADSAEAAERIATTAVEKGTLWWPSVNEVLEVTPL